MVVSAMKSGGNGTKQGGTRGKAQGRSSRGKIHELALSSVEDVPELQTRVAMDLDVMREYTSAWLEDPAGFPPIIVYFDGESYWLADGFYRVRSARKAGLSSIRAEVRDGSKRDALLYAVGANETHGLRRSPEDRRKSVITMLDDSEWYLWSDQEIGRACKVSQSMVSRVRRNSPGLKGHGVLARMTAHGDVRTHARPDNIPESVDRRTFERPPVVMSRHEIVDKYERRLFRHIKKSDPEAERSVPYEFGTLEIASPRTLYAIALIVDRQSLYTVVGRMILARQAMNSRANIVIVGHFPRSVAKLIALLADELGIQCLTPEQILSM